MHTASCRRSIRSRTFALACLLALSFAGCAGIKVKDTLPPSALKGYAEFANYTEGYDVVYAVKDGRKTREAVLEYKGARLRIARTPGSHEFLIENGDQNGKLTSVPVTVTIAAGAVTFVSIDDTITEVTDELFDHRPMANITYKVKVSVAATPAPLRFEPETGQDTVRTLLNDPDWNARLYAVNTLAKTKGLRVEELNAKVLAMASDDPNRYVRRKSLEYAKSLGRDPFEQMLFLENFEANDKRRWVSESGAYPSFYQNDELLLNPSSNKCESVMLSTPLDLPKSFDVDLATIWRSGAENDAYGLIMGPDKDNYDLFGISADGRAFLRLTRNTEKQADLIEGVPVEAITPKNCSDRIKVEVRGNTWSFLVNGAPVGKVENKLEVPPYAFGLIVCKKQAVAFDQLKITRVPEK